MEKQKKKQSYVMSFISLLFQYDKVIDKIDKISKDKDEERAYLIREIKDREKRIEELKTKYPTEGLL